MSENKKRILELSKDYADIKNGNYDKAKEELKKDFNLPEGAEVNMTYYPITYVLNKIKCELKIRKVLNKFYDPQGELTQDDVALLQAYKSTSNINVENATLSGILQKATYGSGDYSAKDRASMNEIVMAYSKTQSKIR